MKRLAAGLMLGTAFSAGAWTPLPTPRPTVRPAATATPRPASTATPRPTQTAVPTAPPGGACACERAPLLRLLPAPMLVSTPAIGGRLRWPDGADVEILLYHSDAPGAVPAAYLLTRIR